MTFLLAGEKCMSEMHLRQLYLHIVLVDHSLKIKKEQKKKKINKKIKKQENRRLKIYLSKRIT